MIDELRSIGLSDLEARIYLALYESPEMSGYEVAKRVSVSRTNVYAALRAMTDKGVCRAIEADPVLYEAVPIGQLVRAMKSRFDRTAQTLLQELEGPPKSAASFYTWRGEQALRQAIERMAANANRTIAADVWSEDVHWMADALLDAERRGVKVLAVVIGETALPLKHLIGHKRSEAWRHPVSRKFSLLCDSRSALIGSFGRSVRLSALETDHPSVIELLRNGLYHDLVMEQTEKDFAVQFEEKYGRDYERIVEPWRELLE
ncbi:TrmB family transcriptional regulator [Paenibacillus ginsengihumi]|uniref:TrmB family transcriptional regulator n=1 Tax=Paenibacillus ginsengihumi TaxID=431596 RepID=UPI000360084F|nr:helix-turn-helix domain-containing protein [Paenibacillus ginsengihumi]